MPPPVQRWGRSARGTWHRLTGPSGHRTLCRRGRLTALREGAPHPLDSFCRICEARHRALPDSPPALGKLDSAEAWAVARAVDRLYPLFRQSSRDLARITSLFMAEHRGLLPSDPSRQDYLLAVQEHVLRRLRQSGRKEPELTEEERLWRIRQAAPRPRVRSRREASEKAALPGLGAWLEGLSCPACGELPDDCLCPGGPAWDADPGAAV